MYRRIRQWKIHATHFAARVYPVWYHIKISLPWKIHAVLSTVRMNAPPKFGKIQPRIVSSFFFRTRVQIINGDYDNFNIISTPFLDRYIRLRDHFGGKKWTFDIATPLSRRGGWAGPDLEIYTLAIRSCAMLRTRGAYAELRACAARVTRTAARPTVPSVLHIDYWSGNNSRTSWGAYYRRGEERGPRMGGSATRFDVTVCDGYAN